MMSDNKIARTGKGLLYKLSLLMVILILAVSPGCTAPAATPPVTPGATAAATRSLPAVTTAVKQKASQTPAAVSTPSQTVVPSVCGQTEPMYIIGLGIDKNETADAIRLIRVDFIEKRVLIFSLPRDMFVPIPMVEHEGIKGGRINAAYGYGEGYEGLGQGIVVMKDTLDKNFGLQFDHHFIFHFKQFKHFIDIIGGVVVQVDERIGNYPDKGEIFLNSDEALKFVRKRQADSDLKRIVRQAVFVKGLFNKLTTPENLAKLPELGKILLEDPGVKSSFTLEDVATFSCLAAQMTGDSLVFVDIPEEYIPGTIDKRGRFVRVPSPEVADYIREVFIEGNY